jgi:NAD(P)H-hydrate epimerase
MVKILSVQQIKELDAATISQEPVASIDLMERACRAFVNWFVGKVNVDKKVSVVCGTGNNGGDGLGIARLLDERGYDIAVWIVRGAVPETEDFKKNLARLSGQVDVQEITSQATDGLFADADVVVDAIFGSGLSRPAEGIYANTIQRINKAEALRVAVDIPSGLMADKQSSGEIVKADYTITFQLPKLAFFLPQAHRYVGNWVMVDIGLSKNFIKTAETSFGYVVKKDACKLLKPRSKFDHKGSFGHALVIAGSYGKMGAAVLSTRATLRVGSGLVSVHVPQSGYGIMQTSVPEAMVQVDADDKLFTTAGDLGKYTTIGIGPGLGKDPRSVKALSEVFAKFREPVVIDADALNILAENPELLKQVPEGSILTPHPKEFERLVGKWQHDFERLEKQKALAEKLKSIIVVKGAFTSIALPGGMIYFNSTGNPGMATGGAGDVLTGILTGLLAQSYSGAEAAILGVYLHGLSGDVVAAERGERGIIASDLIEFLPFAFKKLMRE